MGGRRPDSAHTPLHHIHGIVNVVGCALWSGARCDMLPVFDAATVADRLASGDLTLYMAVPTIYHRLIAHLDQSSEEVRERFREGASRLRLMVSGSAALPIPVLERWRELSGHTLLERYGMTEIGMALSNSYRSERVPGSVGTPLPGVEARLVDENDHLLPAGEPGEIQVRGPTVFSEYWERPDDTEAAFTGDGWFRTGDTAVIGTTAIGSSADHRSTSSRPGARKSLPSRSKRSSSVTRRSARWQWSASMTRSGVSEWWR